MRWPETPIPKRGDTRTRRGFLIIPRCIAGQWRWLEYAVWEQVFFSVYSGSGWEDRRWVEPEIRWATGPDGQTRMIKVWP